MWDSLEGVDTTAWVTNQENYEYSDINITNISSAVNFGCQDPFATNCNTDTTCGCVTIDPHDCANHHKQSACEYPFPSMSKTCL